MLNICQEHYCPRDRHTIHLILRLHFVNPQLNGLVFSDMKERVTILDTDAASSSELSPLGSH